MKYQISIFLIINFSLLNFSIGFSQCNYQLRFEIIDVKNEIKIEEGGKVDSIEVEKQISERLNRLYFEGYLATVILSQEYLNDTVKCKIFKGEPFRLRRLSPGNVEEGLLKEISFDKSLKANETFNIDNVERIILRLLEYSENNGFPFATVKLDSIQIGKNEISASLNWNKGPAIVYDSLEISGYSKLKKTWIYRYLGIIPGEEFRQNSIDLINDKIKDLPFIELAGEPIVTFIHNKAKVKLEATEQKINNVDGILGIFPNSRDDNKILLTGSLRLHLYNLFSSAKQLHFDWQKVNVNSQTLDAAFYYPQFLKMPLGIVFGFSLLKEDTIYLNKNIVLSGDFKPGKNQRINFTTEFENSDLLTNDLEYARLNNFNSYSLAYYGIKYQFNTLDNLMFPRRGFKFFIEGFVGQKKSEIISETNSIAMVNDEVRSTQYKLSTRLENYVNFSRNYVFKAKVNVGTLRGSQLFTNDLFRLGGLSSLRGFNENFFFVSDYLLANMELRLINSDDTYFFAFYDQGVINNRVDEIEIDYPLGTGVGISLGTNSGIFSFIMALGKSRTQLFSLTSAKIHFGYTGRF